MPHKKQNISNVHVPIKLLTKEQGDILKLVGMITMLVDHVGFMFFPGAALPRIIGRLAFPVFAFSIAQGYHFTSDLKKYFFRLILLGIVSQIPFMLAFDFLDKLNIIFTLALGLLALFFFDTKRYFLMLLPLITSVVLPVEYGLYGILLIFSFYFFKKKHLVILFQLMATFLFALATNAPLQMYSLFGIGLILGFPAIKINIHLPKNFFYWFYPIHLALLFIIKLILDNDFFNF